MRKNKNDKRDKDGCKEEIKQGRYFAGQNKNRSYSLKAGRGPRQEVDMDVLITLKQSRTKEDGGVSVTEGEMSDARERGRLSLWE